jgi:hypothetical protein
MGAAQFSIHQKHPRAVRGTAIPWRARYELDLGPRSSSAAYEMEDSFSIHVFLLLEKNLGGLYAARAKKETFYFFS